MPRYKTRLLAAIGIDVMHDVPALEVLPLAQAFSPVNIMPTFPSWVGKRSAAAFGARPPQQRSPATLKAS